MNVEFQVLYGVCALGALQISLAVAAATTERGTAWNFGPRDAQPPLGKIAGRLDRARANFLEMFPFYLAALFAAHATQPGSSRAAVGSMVYLACRVIYLPLYVLGVPVVRTLVFIASVVGIGMIFAACF